MLQLMVSTVDDLAQNKRLPFKIREKASRMSRIHTECQSSLSIFCYKSRVV